MGSFILEDPTAFPGKSKLIVLQLLGYKMTVLARQSLLELNLRSTEIIQRWGVQWERGETFNRSQGGVPAPIPRSCRLQRKAEPEPQGALPCALEALGKASITAHSMTGSLFKGPFSTDILIRLYITTRP